MDNNAVTEFYRNKKVFITGATGFLGKVLLEKILRTCSVDSIYLLIRPKKGMSSLKRLEEILECELFDALKKTNAYSCEKIKVIDGDLTHPNLGISKSDRIFLTQHINIVFHSAATVRFDESLKQSVILNTAATKKILEICQEMKHLQVYESLVISVIEIEYFTSKYTENKYYLSLVYVSTAYSHTYRKIIEETVYKIIPSPEDVIRSVKILPQNVIDALESNILMTHANTYCFTKALAENLVLEYNKLPVAIVRPSVVTSIWKDPTPGWTEGFAGANIVAHGCGSGMINTLLCDYKCFADLIPVDIVINTLITAAWHTVAYRSESIRVYNCVSGPSNKLRYGQFGMLLEKWWRQYPSKHIFWYPRLVLRTSEITQKLCSFWYHIVPAVFVDLWLICTRKKPIMLKITKKYSKILGSITFFTSKDWVFSTSTLKTLAEHVKDTADGHLFSMDVSKTNGFDWEDYVKNYVLGIRKYVLKDDLDSLPEFKPKLKRLYWQQKLFQVSSFLLAASLATEALFLFYYIY